MKPSGGIQPKVDNLTTNKVSSLRNFFGNQPIGGNNYFYLKTIDILLVIMPEII